MKSVFRIFLLFLLVSSACWATNQELTTVTSELTLADFTKAFSSVPECKHDFKDKSLHTLQPSPKWRAVSCDAVHQTLDAFDKTFWGEENNDLFVPQRWIGAPVKFFQHPDGPSDYTERYVQKVRIPVEATVAFVGDIHGSVHALLRNLHRFVALGWMNNDLTFNDNFYLVTLGDYVDRGRWSSEVITLLMMIKMKNWDRCHLVAGNHETGFVAWKNGFADELRAKFGKKDGNRLFNRIHNIFFKRLPVAVFIQCEEEAIQCCHGGIEPTYNPRKLLDTYRALYQSVGPERRCLGLFWNDFCASDVNGKTTRGDGHIVSGKKHTLNYCSQAGIRMVMRAHQDQKFGAKLFFADNDSEEAERTIEDPKQYQNGPYHWIPVMQSLDVNQARFPAMLLDHYPVVTHTAAVEARALSSDCFSTLTTGYFWNEWMLEIYDYFLGNSNKEESREGKYLHIHKTPENSCSQRFVPGMISEFDCIGFSWRSNIRTQHALDSEEME